MAENIFTAPAPVQDWTRYNAATALAKTIGAESFGLRVIDVAEQWGDYSRDFGADWLEMTPASIARFVGWLVAAMVRASN